MNYPQNTAWRAYDGEFTDRVQQLRKNIEESKQIVENCREVAPDMAEKSQRYVEFDADCLRICEAVLEVIERLYRERTDAAEMDGRAVA